MRNFQTNPLLLIVLLFALGAILVTAVAQDDEQDESGETAEEKAERLERELNELRERVLDLERDDIDEDAEEAQDEQANLVEKVAKVVSDPVGTIVDIYKRINYPPCPQCGETGEPIRINGPSYHWRHCKAGHPHWICTDSWLHDHCCGYGLEWTDEFGCVEPGYEPPPKPWYGSGYDASGGSGSGSGSGN